MGTENTASTILQGAQLTAQANAGLSQAIVQGFGQLQSAIKFKADLYNQMIQSTQDARKTDIDEWYKQKFLELNDRQLSIQENHYAADIDYRNAILNMKQKNSAKIASTAPVVAAVKTNLLSIGKQYTELDKLENDLNFTLTGTSRDKDGNLINTGKEPLGPWDGELYNSTKLQLDEVKKKKAGLQSRIDLLNKSDLRIQMGDDPASVYNDTFPEETLTPRSNTNQPQSLSSPQIKMDRTTPMFSDPGIPWRDYTPGSSKQFPLLPANNQKDERNDQGNPATRELVRQIPTENNSSVLSNDEEVDNNYTGDTVEIKDKIYKPATAHESFNNNLIRLSEKNKTDYDVDSALSSLSKTTPEYQQQVLQKQRQIQIEAFKQIGDKELLAHLDPKLTNESLQAVKDITEKYKRSMMKASGDPSLIDIAANKADLAIIDMKNQVGPNTFRAIEEDAVVGVTGARQKFASTYLNNNAEGILFGTQKQAQGKPVGAVSSAINSLGSSVFKQDGTIEDYLGDMVDINGDHPELYKPYNSKQKELDKQSAGQREILSLKNEFAKQYIEKDINNLHGKPPLNYEFKDWISKLQPEDFGINYDINIKDRSKFSRMFNFLTDLSMVEDARTDESITRLLNQRKRELVNDPERAFYFWADKMKRDQVKNDPGYQKFLKENVN